MKLILQLLLLLAILPTKASAQSANTWRLALPGWKYEFPRDHGSHLGFKTEWWYFTGHLESAEGERFGYQLTFFRQGVRLAPVSPGPSSRFVINDLPFAHFAFTDVSKQRFAFSQRLSRGAFGEAGFDAPAADGARTIAWLDDWSLMMSPDQEFTLRAEHEGVEMNLNARALKGWVQHGTNGISQKAEGVGRASHYYSGTRLQTEGTVTIDGRSVAVKGASWFDHEWASNQLAPDQIGWNWFSLILADGTELMLYQMRLRSGGVDPHSSGTFVDATGESQHLEVGDYTLTPIHHWKSQRTGGEYPIEWRVEVPKLSISLTVSTPVPAQELVLEPIAYWEGLVQAKGTRKGKLVEGQGYVELTGYAGELVGLATPSEEPAP